MAQLKPSIHGYARIRVDLDGSLAKESLFEVRWVAVENGILFWYTDEYQERPLGFGILCDITTYEDEQPYVLDKVMTTIILTNNGNARISIAAVTDESSLWLDCLNIQHRSIDKTISAEKVFDMLNSHSYDNDHDKKSLTASMQITLKGQQHTVHVNAYDDVSSISAKFIEDHSLKAELSDRIESELLRTQVDACHLYESSLLRKLAVYRRRGVDLMIAENRRELAEKHAQRMGESMTRIEVSTTTLEKEIIDHRKSAEGKDNVIAQLKNDLATSYSENIELQDKLDYTEQSLQEKIKSLNQSLQELQEQLDALGSDSRPSTPTGNTSMHTGSDIFKSSNRQRYGRHMVPIENTNSISPRADTKSKLRQEKGRLCKQIIDLQEENKKYAHDLRQEINKRHSLQLLGVLPSSKAEFSSSFINSNTDNQDISTELVNRTRKAEERYRLLRSNLVIIEEAKDFLQKKTESQQQSITKLTDALTRHMNEITALKDELQQYYDKLLIDNVMKIESENKQLSEEIMISRKQLSKASSMEKGLRSALALAMQYLQILGPQPSMADALRSWRALLYAPTIASYSNSSYDVDLVSSTKKRRDSGGGSRLANASRVSFDVPSIELDDNTAVSTPIINIDSSSIDQPHIDAGVTKMNLNLDDEPSSTIIDRTSTSTPSSLVVETQSASSASSATTENKIYSRAHMIFNLFSPVVEDRLLRGIYARYNMADSGLHSSVAVMTLTRFIRFAREFGFISSTGNASIGNYLVPGEVDMVFINASKILVDSIDKDNTKPPPTKPFCVRNHFVSYTGLLSIYPSNETLFLAHEATAEDPSDTDSISHLGFNRAITTPGSDSNKFQPISSTTVVTELQFIAAIEQLALKVYARDVEKKVGTVYECLPAREKPSAARYAVELALTKKIIPMADRLDLIPWALIYFDQALSSLSLKATNYNNLSSLPGHLLEWFNYYQMNFDIITGEPYHDPMLDLEASESKDPNHFLQSPLASYLSKASLKAASRANNKHHSISPAHILSYKLFSRFGREFGIVPYLVKEPQLFSIFQEIILWGRTSSEVIVNILPTSLFIDDNGSSMRAYDVKLFDMISATKLKPHHQAKGKNRASDPHRNPSIIGLTMSGFGLALLTVAIQSFHDKPMESRLNELVKWMSKSSDD